VQLCRISRELGERVGALSFGAPVAYVYNPLAYARGLHEQYLTRYGTGTRRVLLLGMNPGPFGMAQTGVPFGEVSIVRDWLGISGAVERPAREHPKRPIQGLDCPRSEVSGARLWGWARQRFETPERFFAKFFVVNYCPLVFMEESGRNVTPDKLASSEREPLFSACDRALRQIADVLEPRHVVGVGAFAEKRLHEALGTRAGLTFSGILHPSPASPKANKNWAATIEAQLRQAGVEFER
jgi:single-strand selective monofunctional uracil DNA glycosylase